MQPTFDQFGNPQPFMPGQMPGYPMGPPGGKGGMWGQQGGAGGPPPPPPPPQPKAKVMNRKMEVEQAQYPFGNQMQMFPGGPQMQQVPPQMKAGEVRLTPAQAKAKAKA